MSYPFPTTLAFSPAQLSGHFGLVTVEQDPNPPLHYRLIIPLKWEQVPGVRRLVTPEHPFALRSHFKAPSSPAAEMQVLIAYVAEEVSPSDWLRLYLRSQSETVLHERHLPQPGGPIPDVLTKSGAAEQERLARWVVLKDYASGGGAHLFVVQASTAARYYTPDLANVLLLLVGGFELLHPVGWPYAEQLRTLARTIPLAFITAYPLSWELVENPDSDEHFYQCQLLKKIDPPLGSRLNLMLLTGQREADLHRLVAESQAALAEEGLEFGLAQLTPAEPIGSLPNVWMSTTVQQQPDPTHPTYEWQVVVSRIGPESWVYADRLGPTQESSPVGWAISRQAFAILLGELQLG